MKDFDVNLKEILRTFHSFRTYVRSLNPTIELEEM